MFLKLINKIKDIFPNLKQKLKKVKFKKGKVSFGMRQKLLLFSISLVAIFCIIITLVLSSRSMSFIEKQATEDIDNKLTVFQLLLEEQELLLKSLTNSLKYDLMDALVEENLGMLEAEMKPLYSTYNSYYGVTHLQVNDPDLKVLYSIHNPSSIGSDGSARPLLKESLGFGSGKLVHGFEFDEDDLVLYSAGPVSSYATQFAGIIEVGRVIDNAYLDKLKERIGVDFTVFKGNERVATTMLDMEGNRALETTIEDADVLDKILGGEEQEKEEGQEGQKEERWVGRRTGSREMAGGKDVFGSYAAIRDAEDNVIGMFFAGTPTLPYDLQQSRDRKIAFAMLAVAIVVSAVFSIFFSNQIVGRLKDLSKVFNALAKGDFTVTVKKLGGDEVGLMGQAVAQMVKDLRGFVIYINELAGRVESLSGEVSGTAENINASVQDVADSANEVASSTGTLSSNAQIMSDEASDTVAKAASGRTEMEKALEQMQAIEKSFLGLKDSIDKLGQRSAVIGEIIQVINEISEQTNLLALNAAIEAARAGEYGRGFAVVADEVRKLAERSSASAEEISHLISDTQKDAASAVSGMDRSVAVVDSGREAMHSSLEKFGEIMLSVQGLMTKIEEIAASTEELGASSEEVAASTEEQLAAVEEITVATGELGTASKFLYEELKKFKF